MRVVLVSTALYALASTSSAHHSTRAFYDRDATIEIEGTVASVFWRNPHVGLTVLVRNERGEQEEWTLEGGAMNTLQRRGFTGDSVAIGDYVRVAGSPSIRGEKAVFVSHFLLPSGREVVFTDRPVPLRWTGTSDTRASAAADTSHGPVADIFRVWTQGVYQLRAPLELTAAARAVRERWDPTVSDPALRCEPPGMPNAILNPYPIEFVDEGDRIVIKIEEWDSVRQIYLTDAIPADARTPSRLGFSTGRWDGDVLIVDTINVDAPYLDDIGTPISIDATLRERFTVDRARGRLDYEVTITDPPNLVVPAVWQATWIAIPGIDVKPYQCTTR